MKYKPALFAIALFWSFSAAAESITMKDLAGTWNYVSYAEIETPEEKMSVGAKMEFRADGRLLMTMSTASVEATFSLDGDTIEYSDSNGQQTWKIQSHEPGQSLVVEHKRALMFFERADDG